MKASESPTAVRPSDSSSSFSRLSMSSLWRQITFERWDCSLIIDGWIFEVAYKNESHTFQTNKQTHTHTQDILADIFPDDTGTYCPNVNSSNIEKWPNCEQNGTPYAWAQLIAGLQPLSPNLKTINVTPPSIDTVVKLITRRVANQAALERHLTLLKRLPKPVPVFTGFNELFDETRCSFIDSKLQLWSLSRYLANFE